MIKSLILSVVLLLTVKVVYSSEKINFDILCELKSEQGNCRIHKGKAAFTTINKVKITSRQDPKYCRDDECWWIAKISDNSLKVGANHVKFEVATVTKSKSIKVKQRLSFYLRDKKVKEITTKRKGRALDRRQWSWDMSLEEISPKLARQVDDFEREIYFAKEGIYNKLYDINSEIERLSREEQEATAALNKAFNAIASNITENFNVDDLRKLNVDLQRFESLRQRKQSLVKNTRLFQANKALRDDYVTQRAAEIDEKLREYGLRLELAFDKHDLDLKLIEIAPEEMKTRYGIEVSTQILEISKRIDQAIIDKNYSDLRATLDDWIDLKGFLIEFISSKKTILGDKVLVVEDFAQISAKINKLIDKDRWYNPNQFSPNSKALVDQLIANQVESANALKQNMQFGSLAAGAQPEFEKALSKLNDFKNKNIVISGDYLFDEKRREIKREIIKNSITELNSAYGSFKPLNSLVLLGNFLNTAGEMMELGLGFVPYLSAGKDFYEAYSGESIRGIKLDSLSRAISVVGVVAAIALGPIGSSKVAKEMTSKGFHWLKSFSKRFEANHLKIGLKETELAESIFKRARDLGVDTKQGLKYYSRVHSVLETLPAGLKVHRIRPGTSPKIAIIGKDMEGNVLPASRYLKEKGIEVEVFQDEELWKEFRGEVTAFRRKVDDTRAHLPVDKVIKTRFYSANKKWAEKLVSEGYMVLDFGPSNKTSKLGEFYKIELLTLFNDIKD